MNNKDKVTIVKLVLIAAGALALLAIGISLAFIGIAQASDNSTENYTTIREWQSAQEFVDMFEGGVYAFEPDICLEVAKMIQCACIEQGYLVSVAFAKNHRYYAKYVSTEGRPHAGIVLESNGHWYFVDPVDWRVTKLF